LPGFSGPRWHCASPKQSTSAKHDSPRESPQVPPRWHCAGAGQSTSLVQGARQSPASHTVVGAAQSSFEVQVRRQLPASQLNKVFGRASQSSTDWQPHLPFGKQVSGAAQSESERHDQGPQVPPGSTAFLKQ
jgi:hypothetical protein